MPMAPRPEAIIIRGAELPDAAALAALMGELGYPGSASAMAARLRGLLAREADHLVAVAEESRRGVVGVVAAAWGLSLERDHACGRVTALCVAADRRGRGIGARLLRHAEAWLRERGSSTCIVNSRFERTAAHRFYVREGYAATGKRFTKAL